MDKIDTDELRRMLEAATPGSWHVAPNGIYVADKRLWWDDGGARCGDTPNIVIDCGTSENAALIALAPDLATEVLASRAREADLQARLDEARAAWEAFEGATITDDHHAAVDRIRAALGIGDHPHD